MLGHVGFEDREGHQAPRRLQAPRLFLGLRLQGLRDGVGHIEQGQQPGRLQRPGDDPRAAHQPQPVPAPPHSDSWLGTRGLARRMKLSSLRCVTWKQ